MSLPALRFKDDGGDFPDWEEKTMGDIFTFIQTNSFSRELLSYETGIVKNIHYGDIHTKFKSNFKIENENVPFIKPNVDLSKISTDCYCKEGDLVIADASEDYADVGKAIEIISLGNQKLLSGLHTYIARDLSKQMSLGFSGYLMQTGNVRLQIKTLATGVSVLGISKGNLTKVKLNIPTKPEQTKIANFLTAVDEKISHLTQKHGLLTQYKKGVMQQIFSRELRFKDDDGQDFPEWEENLLGRVAEITTGSSNRVDSTVDDGAYAFFDRSQDIRTSDVYLFDCEAVIVAGEGQEFIPKHFVGKFDLHQRTYAIMGFKGIDGKFLFYFVYQYRSYFLSQAVGSTVKSLRLPMFQKMPVEIPCLKEQTKIANFLTAIDDKITNTQTQLQAVKQYKQGLLQQMFV